MLKGLRFNDLGSFKGDDRIGRRIKNEPEITNIADPCFVLLYYQKERDKSMDIGIVGLPNVGKVHLV